jgi:hypothetical protein
MFEAQGQAKQGTVGRAWALTVYVAFFLLALCMSTRELWMWRFARPAFLTIAVVILVISLRWLVKQLGAETEVRPVLHQRICVLMLLTLALQSVSRLNW